MSGGPWDDYTVAAAPSPASGPWSKYSGPAAESAPAPSFFDRMLEGDANADKPLLERGTNPMVMDALRSTGRQIGLTARAGLRGLTMLPNMAGDAFGLRSSEGVDRLGDMMYLPRPEGAGERVVQDVASGMASAGGTVGLGKLMYNAGSSVVSKIGDLLRSQSLLQTVSGGSGAGGASIARENGAGPVGELAAGVASAAAPGAAAYAGPQALRQLMRGGEEGRRLTEANLQTFANSGYGSPSVGQASEARTPRAIESLLAKTPGSTGRMVEKAEVGAAGLGDKIDEMASGLAPRTGAAPAGRAISGGIRDFVKDFKERAGELYGAVDQFILPDSRVRVGETSKTLSQLTTVTPGAENLSAQMMNKKVEQIAAAFSDDAQGGTLPYAAVKDLRSRIGEMMSSTELVSDAPRAQLKKIYGALTKDLEAAAQDAGPEAVKTLDRANTYYRSGMKRIDDVLQPILNKTDPEDIFKAAVSGTKEGATTISGVMKSLPKESQQVVAGTMLKRLGLATPGQQNELGEAFSTETFLTNWNKVAPEAKTALFGSMSKSMREDLDAVASVAANIRDGSKVFANPSGTQPAVSLTGAGWGAFVGLMTGHPAVSAAIGGAALSANMTARLMTNPKFVHWLAKSTEAPTGAMAGALDSLQEISSKWKAEDREAAGAYVTAARRLTGQ